ncbi:M12 family metallo-peptidase [Synoicihabitans lomoniglobus]|uniref:M12 family metallo-peptidase n=1 Tax=Synoicihabitans lomoniglobus TaxID=2909285 RepID=A0AAE9ZXD4_9BACT|nr:zinc-dependent metalloprotease [Opitutaceae bacterium LMO-M01]WED64989.1 M12 family metallo-peptidase [Opitutaceae bacterium LMO-M01]
MTAPDSHSSRHRRRRLWLVIFLTGIAGVSWWSNDAAPVSDTETLPAIDEAPPITSSASVPAAAASAPLTTVRPAVPALWTVVAPPANAAQIEQRVEAATRAYHYVAIDEALLAGKASPFWQSGTGRLQLPLPDGRLIEVVVERSTARGPDRFSSEGRVVGVPTGRFILASNRGTVSASLHGLEPGEFKVRTIEIDGARATQLYVVEPELMGDCEVAPSSSRDRVQLPPMAFAEAGARAGVADETLASGDAVVDLLMVYTSAVTAALGGPVNVETEIDLSVAQMNSDFAASGISARIHLAGTLEVEYPDDDISTAFPRWQDEALERISGVTDGYMDEVHAKRDAVGADVVSLIVRRPDSTGAGIAYILERVGHYSEPFYAFSVINYAGMSDATVLSHEVGHSLGCAHDLSNAGATPARGYHGAYPHSYGYRVNAADSRGFTRQVRSIMAYAPGTRLRYYSSPDTSISSYVSGSQTVTFPNPVTFGVAEADGVDAADNTRTIERTAFQVAGYRLSPDRSGAGRLVNVSTRAFVGTGYQTLTGGFVVTGTDARRVLIRAPGPTIGAAPFSVPNALADPVLRVNALGSGLIATNDDWGVPAANATVVASAGQSAGAFSLANGSRDAAVVLDLAPGNYTAEVTGAGGAEGYALIEAYGVGEGGDSRLLNLSTRAFASAADPMVAGFVVQADDDTPGQRKTMFIRVRGPSLVNYGLPADVVMPDPTIEIFDANAELVYFNDDWDAPSADLDGTNRDAIPLLRRGTVDQPSEAAVFAAAMAVGEIDMEPVEPAAVVELPPGLYTVFVRPFESLPDQPGESGVAIVEVFEISP